jgi:hypothetical protein
MIEAGQSGEQASTPLVWRCAQKSSSSRLPPIGANISRHLPDFINSAQTETLWTATIWGRLRGASAGSRLCENDAWGLRSDDIKGLQLSFSDIFLSSTRICASPGKMSLWDKGVAVG